ncbi:MAG: type II toxin-antitoxin system prevent-host-death family antitoxin [Dehalococcoidia bacterium]
MPEIGVREVKTRASAILRDVRDRGVVYTVTYRGRPVGILQPIMEPRLDESVSPDPWDDLHRVGEAIGRGWALPQSSAGILSKMRRYQ